MRLLNKIAVGASAFAFAAALTAGVVASPAPVAKADKNVTRSDNFNFSKSTLTIENLVNSNDQKIIVSYPTVDKNSVLSADKNICTYDRGEDGNVVVDLSTLNPTKDNYIKVSGNNSDTVVYKIPAAIQLGKGTVASSGAITVTKKDKSTLTTTEKSSLEYATTSSNWDKATSMDFSKFLQLGATIRVRVAGTENPNVEKASTIKDKAGNTYTYKELDGNLPGKEIKAKIPKMANAPKAKVDYAKRTITIPKDCQYRINGEGDKFDKWQDEWVKVTANTPLDSTKLDLTKDGAVDVRKAATDTKPASKYSVTSWNKIYPMGVFEGTDKKIQLVTSGPTITGGDVSGGTLGAGKYDPVTHGAVTIKSESTKSTVDAKGKVKVVTSSAITINNKDDGALYEYQYVVVDKGTVPKLTDKVTGTVKKGTEKVVTVKNDSKYKDKDIYIRRAAVKTKGSEEWVTDWVKLATITNQAYDVTIG